MTDILGNIVWYHVSSGDPDSPLPITQDDLEKLFDEFGLNSEFLPPAIKGVDAFRAASGSLSATYATPTEDVKLSVREVSKSTTLVVRHIIRTAAVRGTGNVNTTRVAEIQFHRPQRKNTGRLHGTELIKTFPHSALQGVDQERVMAAIEQFEDRYRKFRNQPTPAALRWVIRSYLIYLDAIPIPAGACWFLPNEREADVRALRAMTHRLGPRCSLDVIPLLDTPELREMLLGNVEEAMAGQCSLLGKSIDEWTQNNPGKEIPVLKYNAFRNDLRGIAARVSEYGRLLQAPLPESAEAIRGALDRLRGLEIATEAD